jgi:hypothetical protein
MKHGLRHYNRKDNPMITYFNYGFSISMTKRQALDCSHQGSCDEDIKVLTESPVMRRQLKHITDEQLINELRESGAWDKEQLQSREDNELRIVWIAACNIREDIREKG